MTRDEVHQLVSQLADVPIDELRPEMELVADLGLDSLGMAELVVHIEGRAAGPVPLDDLVDISDLLAYLGA